METNIMEKITLKHKILFGYIILTAVIVSMVAVLFNERKRVRNLDSESDTVVQIQNHINAIHRQITNLSISGESVIAWNDNDYLEYRERRLKIDTLLQYMTITCNGFLQTEQIDTLRFLFADKEEHLHGIMQVLRYQDKADSLMLNHLPTVDAAPRTITRKRKGIAGWFGKKETVTVPQSNAALYSLNRKLIALQDERAKTLATYTDSLRFRNRELNRKLYTLITNMDAQAEDALQNKKRHLEEAHDLSTCIITWLISVSMLLLLLSYLIIHREFKREAEQKVQMKKVIEKNNELLETRKNIILAISHDIRAPLNIINGSAELAKGTRDKKHRNIYLGNIEHVCKHILHLLNNLLDVYRLNESKEIRNDVTFNLQEFLERIASGFSHIINDKGILFKNDFYNTDIALYGDVDRISQIVDNLLANAVKFTDAGTILFHAAYQDGWLSLEVKDTGIGMSEETIARIFRPFEKLATQTNTDGFGLGLPITKGLVKLLGGTIEVESEPEHGSTFRVSLPLQISDRMTSEMNPVITYNPEALPQRVIAIDDDPLQLEIVKEMLERNGIMCMTFTNVRDLVTEMRKKDYDLLLTDIQMPGTDGFAILELLRSANIGNSRHIPIIVMTARGDQERSSFIEKGFSDCIHKPFSTSELLSLIAKFSHRKDEEDTFSPDFQAFTADVDDKVKLLRMFVRQTRKDMEDLNLAMNLNNITDLREIIHRMRPVLEVLRSDGLLYDYREMLKNEKSDLNAIKEYTERIIGHLSMLTKEAENEIKRINDYETQDTDSRR